MQKVLTFLKRHRRALAGVLLCFFLFAVFAAVWLTHIRGQGDKSSSWAINDQFHSFVTIQEQMEQRFSCDRDLLAVSLVLAAVDEDTPPEGELELILTDSATGEELARSVGDMRYIYNGWEAYYTTLGLDRFVENPGQAVEYTLTLLPHYTGEGRLCVGYEEGGMPAGVSLTVDGQTVDGTVALLGTQARVGGFLTKFYWAFAAGCLAAFALLYGLWCRGAALHRIVFCAVLALGFAFNVVLPPYAAPDEKYHINQSFTLASSMYDPHLPLAQSHIRETLRRPSDQDPLIQVDETTVFTWQHIAKVLGQPNTDPMNATHSFDEYQVDANNTLYWVSAFGVLLGYKLRLGFAATLYLGRLANLLFFACFAAWAVKKTPVAKAAFAAAALLPMTLHLAASYSRDSNLLALCFLFCAWVLDLAYGPRERPGWRQLLPAVVLAVLLVPCKVVYLPLAALVLLIPKERLGGRRARWLKAGFLALCAAAFLLNSGAVLVSFTQTGGTAAAGAVSSAVQEQVAEEQAAEPAPDSSISADAAGAESASDESGAAASQPPAEAGAAPETAQTSANSISSEEDMICFTLPYILAHPLETAELCIRSVVEQGDHYLRTLVGGTLGYFGLDKPLDLAWGWVVALYALLGLVWLCPGGAELPLGRRWACFAIALCCCGLAVAGCISWTPTYYTTIYGFQGRYFLPVLPLLLLVPAPRCLRLSADCGRGLILALAVVDVGVLLNAFLAVVAR